MAARSVVISVEMMVDCSAALTASSMVDGKVGKTAVPSVALWVDLKDD